MSVCEIRVCAAYLILFKSWVAHLSWWSRPPSCDTLVSSLSPPSRPLSLLECSGKKKETHTHTQSHTPSHHHTISRDECGSFNETHNEIRNNRKSLSRGGEKNTSPTPPSWSALPRQPLAQHRPGSELWSLLGFLFYTTLLYCYCFILYSV